MRSYHNHSLSLSVLQLYAGVLNDVLDLILQRLKGSIFIQTSDHEQKEGVEEEQAKENLSRKAFQFMTALARLVYMNAHKLEYCMRQMLVFVTPLQR